MDSWLAFAFLLGLFAGLLYFGGLWVTVARLPTSRCPAMMMLTSFALRVAAVLSACYFVMGGRWEPAVACLAGFVAMRTLAVWYVRRPVATEAPLCPHDLRRGAR